MDEQNIGIPDQSEIDTTQADNATPARRGRPPMSDEDRAAKRALTLEQNKQTAHQARKAADQFRYEARGRDEGLAQEINQLREHVNKAFPQEQIVNLLRFLDYGETVLRDIHWKLKPASQCSNLEAYENDRQQPIHARQYASFIDALCMDMVNIARSTHLTPELSEFELKVLRKALDWSDRNSEYRFEWKPEIETEHQARQAGQDTFTVAKLAPGKRGPKPQPIEYPSPDLFRIHPATAKEPEEVQPSPDLPPELSPGQKFLAERMAETRRKYSPDLPAEALRYLEQG